MLKINFRSYLLFILSLFTLPSASFSEELINDRNFRFNRLKSDTNCSFYQQESSARCISSKSIYEPQDNLDRFILGSFSYASRFIPLLNNGSQGSEYSNLILNDAKNIIADSGYKLINSTINQKINEIPFFAQTNFSVNVGSDSNTSFSLNSLQKLSELGIDNEGDIRTLAFSQVRFSSATNSDGATTNLGLGIRHRPSDVSMIGSNVFWDYRMTDYSSAHSRLGVGGEYWWKDLEFRNNWYMSMTDQKNISINGTEYQERVVPGWDVEIGYRLPNKPNLSFYVKGFNWDYQNTQDNSGLKGSINWQATPYVNLDIWISNEIDATQVKAISKLPGIDETFFGLGFKISSRPIIFSKQNYKKNLLNQMTQPVKRRYEVLLERSIGGFQNRAKGNA
tara:strand:+ start:2938 stop:4119 length:1182 start_codon:yes stop_codon:yes gene_type:complete